jgi:hypothetical protein
MVDESHNRMILLFVDAVLSSIDCQQQTTNLDEILDELPVIFHALCNTVYWYSRKLRPNAGGYASSPSNAYYSPSAANLSIDDSNTISDVLYKMLLCLDLFSGCTNNFKPSPSIAEKILNDFDAIR